MIPYSVIYGLDTYLTQVVLTKPWQGIDMRHMQTYRHSDFNNPSKLVYKWYMYLKRKKESE